LVEYRSVRPRLPDTVEELREAASSLGADPARDILLGGTASEESASSLLRSSDVDLFAMVSCVMTDERCLAAPVSRPPSLPWRLCDEL
jgi:hypothetical protein